MDAQTLSKHELFDQIESCIARMIDILKNRPRFQAPAIVAATTTPPPTVADPPPNPTPTSSVVQNPALNTAPVPVLKPTSSHEHFAPLNTHHPLSNRQITLATTSARVFSTPPCQQDNQNSQKDNESSSREGVADEREWHPPWRSVTTAPNTVGRFEWHPPWKFPMLCPNFNLVDKVLLRGME
ncbi:hypothetical protein HanRHA438_Chr07g0294241 [Helianthus annuus]|uniref:Uncharacterized protein n=1 Tax=Helianthus annuus TaxID=4232 RepID=A0A9K3IJR4_HELAN|nr:hypothetical protein HanXRQr2_Chr07g0283761 [Helianthus annuus]KAJ0555754.1 hypothetical protein HanIR_Chr07g0305731 [Helianthus annuus]KAJ0903833.1 hypothetical protein HanPSC8_Chr07g0274591 [Helianthus annuus]KAJ0907046.1 hypothetical protein HanRHA438_Chr07g0294241 [Helianthus annuus]